MDDADRAADYEERAWQELERRISAAREAQCMTPIKTYCVDCMDILQDHRRKAGICVDCLEKRETEERLQRWF